VTCSAELPVTPGETTTKTPTLVSLPRILFTFSLILSISACHYRTVQTNSLLASSLSALVLPYRRNIPPNSALINKRALTVKASSLAWPVQSAEKSAAQPANLESWHNVGTPHPYLDLRFTQTHDLQWLNARLYLMTGQLRLAYVSSFSLFLPSSNFPKRRLGTYFRHQTRHCEYQQADCFAPSRCQAT
jgi:hypothetical protein